MEEMIKSGRPIVRVKGLLLGTAQRKLDIGQTSVGRGWAYDCK